MVQLKIENLIKIYNKNKPGECCAINGISIDIEKGDCVALIGKSGSGKSTLLHILGCIDTFTDGEYFFEEDALGDKTPKFIAKVRNKKIGFIQQDYALISSFTVFDNIAIPLYIEGLGKNIVKSRVNEVAEQLDIKGLLKKRANQLSGGQCQRVAIARAIVANPEIILADEPTGALDSENTNKVMDILMKLNQEGRTVIIATHDMNVAAMCKRKIELKDGKII